MANTEYPVRMYRSRSLPPRTKEEIRIATLAYKRKWAEKNKEKCQEYQRASYRKRAERARLEKEKLATESGLPGPLSRLSPSDRLAKYGHEMTPKQQYRAKESAQIVERIREWRKKNPEAVARHAAARRAKKAGSSGKLSRGLQERLYKLQKGCCACCGLPLGVDFHLDHITPLAKGGLNIDSNIQLLRAQCNHEKGPKDPIEFMQMRGKLL